MTIDERTVPGDPPADDDAWLESLIRSDAAATSYVDDAGFTDAVIARLPAPGSRARNRWIVPGMALLGFLVGLVALSGGEALSHHVAQLASLESLSMRHLMIVGLPLGILYWIAVGAALQER